MKSVPGKFKDVLCLVGARETTCLKRINLIQEIWFKNLEHCMILVFSQLSTHMAVQQALEVKGMLYDLPSCVIYF